MEEVVWRKWKRGLLAVALAILTTAGFAERVDRSVERKPRPLPSKGSTVTVYRDQYGVPHVWGPTDASVVFGFVYAQAEDNFWGIEDNYIRALGRAAEVYGASEVTQDLVNASLDIPGRARQDYAESPTEVRRIADAVAAGLNRFLEQHPQEQPRLLRRFEPWYTFALIRYFVFQQFEMGLSGLRPPEIVTVFDEEEDRRPGTAAPRGASGKFFVPPGAGTSPEAGALSAASPFCSSIRISHSTDLCDSMKATCTARKASPSRAQPSSAFRCR